jgi:hypothetical protein
MTSNTERLHLGRERHGSFAAWDELRLCPPFILIDRGVSDEAQP